MSAQKYVVRSSLHKKLFSLNLHNVCLIKIRSKYNSNTLLLLLRIFMRQTLITYVPMSYKALLVNTEEPLDIYHIISCHVAFGSNGFSVLQSFFQSFELFHLEFWKVFLVHLCNFFFFSISDLMRNMHPWTKKKDIQTTVMCL